MFRKHLDTVLLFLCRFVLPIFTIYFLMILPGFMERSLEGNSKFVDGATRTLITIFFCANYWQFPVLFDPSSEKWLWISKAILQNPILLRGYYLFIGAGYIFSAVWLTYYAFSTFLPELERYRLLASVVNGLIFAAFFLWRYSFFMELVKKQKV